MKPNTWICDQIVNISVEVFEFDKSQIQMTDTFFYTELNSLNERLSLPRWTAILDSFKTWVIPINFDFHWSLILLKNRANDIYIECWDSLPTKSRIDRIKSQLISSYKKCLMPTKSFSISYNNDCYVQSDKSSCGIFLIGNMFAFTYNKKPCNLDLKNSRIAIARMILSAVQK